MRFASVWRSIGRERRARSPLATTFIGWCIWERFQYIGNAISREKELKDWNRGRKIALVEAANPTWEDLAADW